MDRGLTRLEPGDRGASDGVWAVVNTQPRREGVAREHLERQGYRVYCPVILKRVGRARRSHDAERPLFPSYIFVNVDVEPWRWRPILSTVGVRTLVRCGDRPSLIDDGFIQSLKAREIDGVIARPKEPLAVGQRVRLASGSFAGLAATIIEMTEKDRLVALMDLLGRPVRVRVATSRVAVI